MATIQRIGARLTGKNFARATSAEQGRLADLDKGKNVREHLLAIRDSAAVVDFPAVIKAIQQLRSGEHAELARATLAALVRLQAEAATPVHAAPPPQVLPVGAGEPAPVPAAHLEITRLTINDLIAELPGTHAKTQGINLHLAEKLPANGPYRARIIKADKIIPIDEELHPADDQLTITVHVPRAFLLESGELTIELIGKDDAVAGRAVLKLLDTLRPTITGRGANNPGDDLDIEFTSLLFAQGLKWFVQAPAGIPLHQISDSRSNVVALHGRIPIDTLPGAKIVAGLFFPCQRNPEIENTFLVERIKTVTIDVLPPKQASPQSLQRPPITNPPVQQQEIPVGSGGPEARPAADADQFLADPVNRTEFNRLQQEVRAFGVEREIWAKEREDLKKEARGHKESSEVWLKVSMQAENKLKPAEEKIKTLEEDLGKNAAAASQTIRNLQDEKTELERQLTEAKEAADKAEVDPSAVTAQLLVVESLTVADLEKEDCPLTTLLAVRDQGNQTLRTQAGGIIMRRLKDQSDPATTLSDIFGSIASLDGSLARGAVNVIGDLAEARAVPNLAGLRSALELFRERPEIKGLISETLVRFPAQVGESVVVAPKAASPFAKAPTALKAILKAERPNLSDKLKEMRQTLEGHRSQLQQADEKIEDLAPKLTKARAEVESARTELAEAIRNMEEYADTMTTKARTKAKQALDEVEVEVADRPAAVQKQILSTRKAQIDRDLRKDLVDAEEAKTVAKSEGSFSEIRLEIESKQRALSILNHDANQAAGSKREAETRIPLNQSALKRIAADASAQQQALAQELKAVFGVGVDQVAVKLKQVRQVADFLGLDNLKEITQLTAQVQGLIAQYAKIEIDARDLSA